MSVFSAVVTSLPNSNRALLAVSINSFDTHKIAPQHWNQAFTIKDLPETINSELLKNITDNIIKSHDA